MDSEFLFVLSCILCFFLHSPSFTVTKSLRDDVSSISIFSSIQTIFDPSFDFSCTFFGPYFFSFSQEQNTFPLMFSQLITEQQQWSTNATNCLNTL